MASILVMQDVGSELKPYYYAIDYAAGLSGCNRFQGGKNLLPENL